MNYNQDGQNNGQGYYNPPPINDFGTPTGGHNKGTTAQTLGILALVFSVICCCSPIVGLVLGILAVVYSVKAKNANGFMPAGATVGRICGIIAIVICGLIFATNLILNLTGFYDQFLAEFEKQFNEMYPNIPLE